MADFQDVITAQHEADSSAYALDAYGGAIEDGRISDAGLALCLVGKAIGAEIRHLAVRLDYLAHELSRGS